MHRSIAATGLTVLATCFSAGPSSAEPSRSAASTSTPQRTPMQEHVAALASQCPTATRLPELEAARLPIDVTRWGSSGPRVLIVHGGVQGGLGGGPSTFAKQKILGDEGWRLEVVDRPGFGKSPSRGIDDMEADAGWIADMLGDDANLIGHSWGGAEALLAAARRPQAVRSLILVEPAVRVLLAADPALANQPAIKADTERFASTLMKAKTPAEYGIAFARSLGSAEGKQTNAIAEALERDPERAAKQGCALLQARQAPFPVMKHAAETVAKAGIPVLIITGGWNALYESGANLLATLTHGRHIVVASPNHFVQSSSAEDFNKAVVDFMHQADARSGQPASAGR